MRRTLTALLVGLALVPAPALLAKFGMSKTKVLLHRVRPPETPPLAETVALDVRSEAPEVTGAHVSIVRGRLEEGLEADRVYRLVDRLREADAVVRVRLAGLSAEIRDEIRYKRKSVKVGEKQVWDEKKKKYKTESVYANRDVPVSWRIAQGHVTAGVEVGPGDDPGRPEDGSASYFQEFEQDEYSPHIPPEAASEESLRRFLIGGVAERAVAMVCRTPDPVEALLAVNGELKPGNKFAEAGLFKEALQEWIRKTYKGDTEAARLHNVGVAHEALAYKLPPHDPEHLAGLRRAQDFYNQARSLDPDEKYFRDPPIRIEQSLAYAENATRFAADLERFREEGRRRADAPPTTRPPAPPRAETKPAAPAKPAPAKKPRVSQPAPDPARTPPATKPAPEPAGLSGSASTLVPLRNGSFEASLAPWAMGGKGAVLEESGRGRVLEVVASASEGSVRQIVGVDVPAGHAASLSLDYRVTGGEGAVRVLLAYADAAGKERSSTLPVTAGESPGGWSSWSGDVSALRPRPARVKEVRIVVEGGTVRLDNVALTVR